MNRSVTQSLQEVDVVLLVVEALKFDELDAALQRLLPAKVPVVLAINKIDRLGDKNALLPFIRDLSERFQLNAIVPVVGGERRADRRTGAGGGAACCRNSRRCTAKTRSPTRASAFWPPN